MHDEISELETTVAELEKELELANLKIEELESENKFLQNGANLLVDEYLKLDDLQYQNDELKDKNERLTLSLLYAQPTTNR